MSEPQKLVPGGQSLVGGGQWSAAPPPVPDRPDTLTGLPVPGYLRQLMGETVGRAAAGIGQGADVANQGLWALANLPPAVMARLGGNPPPAPGPMPESLAALIRKKFGIVPQEELGTLQERIGALAWEGLGPAVLAAGAGQVARSVARGWGAPAAGDNFLWTNKHSVFEGEPATRFEVMHAGGQDTEFLNVRQQPDGRWAVVDQQHRVLSEHPTDVAAGQAAERVLPQMFPQPGARGASRDPLERAVAWARSLGERGSAGEQRTLPGMPEPAPKVGPLWRDNILDALEQAPQEKMTPAQLQAHLGKYRGTKDQADWIGLSDFLEGKKSVTRAEVRQFVEENPLRVEERVLGQELPISYERFRQKYGYNDTPQARREYESDLANGVLASKGTKYDQYQTPGGENYRELLLKMPRSEQQELIAQRRGYGAPAAEGVFQHAHWPDDPNVLAHVRFNERRDVAGVQGVHIEEVQSDWHQTGAKEGYVPKTPRDPLEQVPFGEVPDAPFKKTWPMLAMKRMIRWAAEHDVPQITWPSTAEQIAQTEGWGPVETRKGWSVIEKNKAGDVVRADFSESEVEAKQVLSRIQEAEREVRAGGSVSIQPDTKYFAGGADRTAIVNRYLVDYPRDVNKFVKRWGGRVDSTEIPVPYKWDEYIKAGRPEEQKTQRVHRLTITPEMKQKALRGMELSQAADPTASVG